MNIKRFWADLSLWNKFGLCFVIVVMILVLVFTVFL